MEILFNTFIISDDKTRLDIEIIGGFLSRSYWANERPIEKTQKAIENSLCYGVYDQNRQIGFARVITDGATMYYLCDVFIDEHYRGQGIGKKLVETIVSSEALHGINGVLGTKDAHSLYESYGFNRVADRYMRRAADANRR
ncbi:Acetyltransferase (GNAT) family protein [Paenibacillus sp. 1_12]|uniref:GNAT family N-acetyltransferase n=1 Tax=Paenibacillus sp. 1_12 TaxID=1566278 RepID=UPI0008DF83B3|nr:GNAT family N-acetyltransferase [Paenibacillus sp. 1_12]SFM02147.1 Acetyltransferase (GNAT) family protein [Paenibacillus sp. 1_12]